MGSDGAYELLIMEESLRVEGVFAQLVLGYGLLHFSTQARGGGVYVVESHFGCWWAWCILVVRLG